MPIPKAILRTVYAYYCEECGRENIVRPILVEASPEELEELMNALGNPVLEEGDTIRGDFVRMPSRVTCQHCQQVHFTLDDAGDVPPGALPPN